MVKKLSLSVLRTKDFRLLLLTRMCVMMALQSQAVIVGWQVYSLTKDPFLLGLTGLTEAVPAIFGAFFSGHIVDIGQPRKIYTLCIATLALNTFMLLIIAGGIVPLSDKHVLYYVFCGI